MPVDENELAVEDVAGEAHRSAQRRVMATVRPRRQLAECIARLRIAEITGGDIVGGDEVEVDICPCVSLATSD